MTKGPTKGPTRGRGPRSSGSGQQRQRAGGQGEARRKGAGKSTGPTGRASRVPEWAQGAFAQRGKRKSAAVTGRKPAASSREDARPGRAAATPAPSPSRGRATPATRGAGAAGRKSERAAGRKSERATGRKNERAAERKSERAAERKGERAVERKGERAAGRKSERATGRKNERAAERKSERVTARGAGRATAGVARGKGGAAAAGRRGVEQRQAEAEQRQAAGQGAPWGAGKRAGGGKRAGKHAAAAGVGAEVEVFIESLAAGGDGVGRDDRGRVTFVPYTAPGDTVTAQVIEVHKDFARAEPIEIDAASAYRVSAPCPHFVERTCGGCQWQHLGDALQASAKDELCARLLRKHVSAGLELRGLRAEVEPYYWRRRARLHWYRPRKAAGAIIGFYGPRSHHVSDIAACMQLEPVLKQAVDVMRDRLAPVLGRQGTIEAVAGHLGEVHVFIHGPADREIAAALVGQGPIVGVMLGDDDIEPRVRDGAGREPVRPVKEVRRPPKRAVQSFGRPHIELEPGLLGRADWFAQPSRAGNQLLLEVVDRAAAPRAGLRVLELHAGSGNLTRVLVPGAAELVAVDYRKPPWPLPEELDRSFVAGDVAEVTQRLAAEGRKFDLVVLDPPRTGAREVIASVVALAPGRIVYVSCDPATLARDLDGFAEAGYRARWAQPLDLMPQTAHVELVVVLERAPTPPPLD